MTQFGFLASNNNGQVLISSKTKNLHFLGKATFYSTLQSSNNWGGIRRWAFRIKSPTTPTPFFSVPTSDRYAISRMSVASADTWEIEIIRSGTSTTIPEVYVFTEINSQTRPVNSYGMQVFTEDGTGTTFDSRMRPLVVKGGTQVLPPYDPRLTMPSPNSLSAQYCSSDAGSQFAPNKVNSTFLSNTNLTKPIVSYQSVSQTMRQVNNVATNSYRDPWYSPIVTYEQWQSNYWAFYRAAVSAQQSGASTYINTGWVTINYGCVHGYDSQDSLNLLTVDLVNLGGDSSQGGTWPYTNLTINLNYVPIVLADGSMYD